MYSIRLNEMVNKFEYRRNRDGELLDETPAVGGPLAFYLAFRFGRKHPHTSGIVWRAAQLVQAGHVTPIAAGHRRVSAHYDHTRIEQARVSSQSSNKVYVVYKIQAQEGTAPSAPMPPAVYGCTCPHWQEGNGSRPYVNGQPYCKHIVAAIIEEECRQRAAKWEALREEEVTPALRQAVRQQQQAVRQEAASQKVARSDAAGAIRRRKLSDIDRQVRARQASPAQPQPAINGMRW